MKTSQIAIATASTAPGEPWEEKLAAYSAAGFRRVELQLDQAKRWMTRGRRAGDLGKLLENFQLRCIGGFECPIECFSDAGRQRENHNLLVANARLLAELGGEVLVVGTDGPSENSLSALETIGAVMRKTAERFPKSVALAVEFNWSPVVKSLRSAVGVAQAARSERVGIVFDVAHYHCTSSKLEDINHVSVPLFKHVHINDMRPKPGEHSHCNDDRVLPGSGQGGLDVKGIVRRIESLGYRGYFSLELFNPELWKVPSEKISGEMYRAMAGLCSKGQSSGGRRMVRGGQGEKRSMA